MGRAPLAALAAALAVSALSSPLSVAAPFSCARQDAACAFLGQLYWSTNGPVWGAGTNWSLMASTPLPSPPLEYCTALLGLIQCACYDSCVTSADGQVAAGQVTNLNFYNQALDGPLPASVSTLTELRALQFTNPNFGIWNNFVGLTGALPDVFGALTNLGFVALTHNSMAGPVPPSLVALAQAQPLALLLSGSGLCGGAALPAGQPGDGHLPPCPSPPPQAVGDVACAKVTNRWPLTASAASGSLVIDTVGSWNGVAHGGYAYSAAGITLDGVSGYVDLGSRTFGGAMSWAFWAKLNTRASWARWLDWGSGARLSNLLLAPYVAADAGHSVLQVYSAASANTTYVTGYSVPLGVWQHYVWTLDAAGAAAFYVNGALVFTQAGGVVGGAADVTRSHLLLGKSLWPRDPFLDGSLSDLQLALGSVLSASDAANLAAGRGCPSLSSPPPPPASAAGYDWANFGFDAWGTNVNPFENAITSAALSAPGATLAQAWSATVIGSVLAQPLVLARWAADGGDAVIVCTLFGWVTMFHARTGAVIWKTSVVAWTAPVFNVGGFDNVPQAVFGISGTPLASRAAGALYVVSNAFLYCLNLADGSPCRAWASVSLGDAGQNTSTAQLKYASFGAVVLRNGLIFVDVCSHGDAGISRPYFGHVAVIDASTGARLPFWYTVPTTAYRYSGAGIWGDYGGFVLSDLTPGFGFEASGNGIARTYGQNETQYYAQSVTKLAIGSDGVLTPVAKFSGPKNNGDDDFAAVPVVFAPGGGCPKTLVAAHQKGGELFILDAADLSLVSSLFVGVNIVRDWVAPPTWSPRHGLLFISFSGNATLSFNGLTAWAFTAECAIKPAPVWQQTFGGADFDFPFIQPTVVGDLVLTAGGGHQVFYAVNAVNGKLLFTSPRLDSTVYGSPTAVNGRLYVVEYQGGYQPVATNTTFRTYTLQP